MSERLAALAAACAGLEPPFAALDLPAWRANAADLVARAAGRPIRCASKSIRSRQLLRDLLARPGFAGVLAYTLPEALWLAGDAAPVAGGATADGTGVTCEDVVVGYPSSDAQALLRLVRSTELARRVTLMVDDVAHLDLIDDARRHAGRPSAEVRICLDLDASLRLAGRLHVGVRRSPVHEVSALRALAAAVTARPGLRLVGLMAYEAQVAGLQDAAGAGAGAAARNAVLRRLQALSLRELAGRRAAAVAAAREFADLEFVNGGGTGSVERTAADPSVTEIAAGSGLFAPVLFDGYRGFDPLPAAYFVLPVARRPAPGLVTVSGGGWIASGPAGADRSPVPVWPAGLRLLGAEGAGEVQTPLRGAAAKALRVGDHVWFRHAKAGELCEHVNELHLLDDPPTGPAVHPPGAVHRAGAVRTYRGEARAFL